MSLLDLAVRTSLEPDRLPDQHDVDAPGRAPLGLERVSRERGAYFVLNDEGLLERHDYDVEINAGNTAAHYVSGYDEVAGIKLPSKHRIFPRTPDGQSLDEPLFVSIDLSEIEFATADVLKPQAVSDR